MTIPETGGHPWLLDEETWESPGRLTAADLYAEAGAYRRSCMTPFDDPEEDR